MGIDAPLRAEYSVVTRSQHFEDHRWLTDAEGKSSGEAEGSTHVSEQILILRKRLDNMK